MKNIFLVIFTLILGFWNVPILAKEIDAEVAILWSKFPEKISVVKTLNLGKLPVDDANSVKVCGAGYFFTDLKYLDEKNKIKIKFIKFNSEKYNFDELEFNISAEDSTYDGILRLSNYYCEVSKVNGEQVIILRSDDDKHPHTVFIVSGAAHVVWGVSVVDDNEVLFICYGEICDRNKEKSNKYFLSLVKFKYLPEDISSVQFVGRGENPLIIYTASNFNEKTNFCSNLNNLNSDLDLKMRINVCSVIVQNYEFVVARYSNNYYYLVPSNLNGEFMYYYKCLDENNCTAGVFGRGAVLLSGTNRFEKGAIAAYGGLNTLVSDTFGPNVMFCVNPYTPKGEESCIGRATWKIDSEQGDNGDYQDLFYSEGKFYFVVVVIKNSEFIMELEEVIP